MFSWIFYGLLFYFLFKLVVDFIFPIVMTTRKVKQQFNSMKQKTEDQQQQSGSFNPRNSSSTQHKKVASKDDYIDFEEIKN
jgi:hypothetical protein